MNVGQLIQRLNAFPPDMPVVLEMEDEPCGDYELATIDGVSMQHDPIHDPWRRVYHDPDPYNPERCESPRDVVLLGSRGRGRSIVDAEPERAATKAGRTP